MTKAELIQKLTEAKVPDNAEICILMDWAGSEVKEFFWDEEENTVTLAD